MRAIWIIFLIIMGFAFYGHGIQGGEVGAMYNVLSFISFGWAGWLLAEHK